MTAAAMIATTATFQTAGLREGIRASRQPGNHLQTIVAVSFGPAFVSAPIRARFPRQDERRLPDRASSSAPASAGASRAVVARNTPWR